VDSHSIQSWKIAISWQQSNWFPRNSEWWHTDTANLHPSYTVR